MITLEHLIWLMNDETKIVLRDFDNDTVDIYKGDIDEFKQTLYETYKSKRVGYIEPDDYVLYIYIKV